MSESSAQGSAVPHTPQRTAAIVVTHEPDFGLFSRVLKALAPQCQVIVVDNGSSDEVLAQVTVLVEQQAAASLLELRENTGIAHAQNAGIRQALAARPTIEFVLTLDHDSVVPEDFVNRLQREFDSHDKALHLAAVGPTLIDPRVNAPIGFQRRRGPFWSRFTPVPGQPGMEVDGLNSSGSLISVRALRETGLFESGFFIDHVETEWCFRAKSRGYRLWGSFETSMEHRMGDDATTFWFFGRRVWPYRSPRRHYFIFRNSLALQRRPYVPGVWKLWNLAKLALTFIVFGSFAVDAAEQRRQMRAGLRDGWKSPPVRLRDEDCL